jgi:GT2 family glycosyltransferase
MKCTAIIINFLREPYLWKCLDSLSEVYPKMRIRVGENGEYTKEKKKRIESNKNAKYYELPFDSGVCVGRNTLMTKVKTKYVLVGDDDFQYTKDAKVQEMIDFLEAHPEIDLIGGRVFQDNQVKNYQGYFNLKDDLLDIKPLDIENTKYEKCEKTGLRYTKCDITFNYFIARVKSIRPIKWDEKIKVAYEHASFFIALKEAGKHVVFSPDPIVIHKPKIDEKITEEYSKYRLRRCDKAHFFEKHNINILIDMHGRQTTAPPIRRENVGDGEIGQITAIIKTFKRNDCLEKLLFSIAKKYPDLKILIGDGNKVFNVDYYKELWNRLFKVGIQVKPIAINLPYDCGLGKGRNELVGHVKTKYTLLLDDDFIFTEDTKLEIFKDILDKNEDIGVVGGMMYIENNELHFEGKLKRKGEELIFGREVGKYKKGDGYKYALCDYVLNFALFKTELFDSCQWDDRLKIAGEHTDFYLNLLKTRWKVAYTPDVTAIHAPTMNSDYKNFRKRTEFLKMMMNKHKLKRLYYEKDRFVYELNEENLKYYKRIT